MYETTGAMRLQTILLPSRGVSRRLQASQKGPWAVEQRQVAHTVLSEKIIGSCP